ncbi:MAG: hypothetical protein ACLFTK_15240, partial [Anaerolineales bacterium]
AIEQQTGARSLRGIIERVLLDVMFEIPSSDQIAKVVIEPTVIHANARPAIYDHDGKRIKWGKDGRLKLTSAA